jgi:hypothetical protein
VARPRGRSPLLLAAGALVPLLLFLAAERRIAGAAGLPLDDSWIHLHFARNLAEGAGFAYNPGAPVAGSTAPLWTLLLGLAFALGGPSLLLVKALGVAATLAAALLARAAVVGWGASPAAGTAAALALLAAGPMVWASLSGMEVPLAAALVAGALAADSRRREVLAAALAALAPLARPEAGVFTALLALARPSRRRLAVFAILTATALAPAVAFSLATVGLPVPATAAAKVEGGLLGLLAGAREPWHRLLVERPAEFALDWVRWLWTTHWLLPLALVPALVVVWRRHGAGLGLPALALVAHPVAMALLAPYRGPGFQEGRYSTHLLPLAFVVLAAALGPRWNPRRTATAAVWLALALIALLPAAERYGWAVQNINAMQVHLGRWVDRHLPARARLALNDVGAIAYLSRREVIDLMGLVTPEVLPYRRRGERGVIEFLQHRCPDYVIIFPAWFPALAARRDLLEPVYRVRLERNVVAGAPEMVVYRLRCAV